MEHVSRAENTHQQLFFLAVYHPQVLWYRVICDQLVLVGRQQISALLEAPLKVRGHLNSVWTQEEGCLCTPAPTSCRILHYPSSSHDLSHDLLLLGSAEQLDHAVVLLVGILHLVLYQGGAAGVGHRFNEDLTLLDLPRFLRLNATDLIGDVLQEE